jgi:hypothetical protein
MLTARMSKMMMIGMVLSMLALVAVWPVLAQDPSASAGVVEREQLQIIRNQLAASGYSLQAGAPSALPATGSNSVTLSGVSTALGRDQWEIARNQLAASGWVLEEIAPTDLPATGLGTLVGRDQLEIVRYQLAASGFTLESAAADAPAALPVTGASKAIFPSLDSSEQHEQWRIVVNQLAASGVQVDMGVPEALPVTGAQPNPYLELLEQYREMYGGY